MADDIVRRGKNFVEFADGRFRIDNVRLSYPHLDAPYAGRNNRANGENSTPAFSGSFLAPKDTHKEAKDALLAAIRRFEAEKKKEIAKSKRFIRDGDGEGPGCGKPETKGMYLIVAREQTPPILRDAKKRNVERVDAKRIFYGGCYVNVMIRPWWQDNSFGTRINANLLAVQFAKDGEPFGQGRISEEDVDNAFDDVGEDDEDSGSRTSGRVQNEDEDEL